MKTEVKTPRVVSDKMAINILLMAVAGMGLVIGMTFPLFTLTLQRLDFSATMIGLNSATGSLGILVVGLLTGRMMARHGAFLMISTSCLLSILSLVAMPLIDFTAGWFIVRFLLALGAGFLWLISETWINSLATRDTRGHVMGLYGAAFSFGFAVGPLLVSLLGSTGWLPYIVTATIMTLSSMPMVLLAGSHKGMEKRKASYGDIFQSGAFIFIIAFAAGLFETTAYALMPVYTLGEGLGEKGSLYALSAFSAGGIVLQYPMGKVADILGRFALMVMVAVGVLGCVIIIPFVIDSLPLLLTNLFFLGGSVFGLYTLGLILLGDRFGTESLVAANAVFIILFEAGGVTGPALAGITMEAWPANGFIGFLLVASIVLAVVTIIGRNRT